VSSPFVGTRHLARLMLRRDRLRLPLWLVGLGGVIAVSALSVPPIYDTPRRSPATPARSGPARSAT
jgi:ABC-2 type transport system permease protein